MSSILEALEKAEEERERESGVPLKPVATTPNRKRFEPRTIGVIVLAILALNALIWFFLLRDKQLPQPRPESASTDTRVQATSPAVRPVSPPRERQTEVAKPSPKPVLSLPDQLKRAASPSAKPLIDEAVVARPEPRPEKKRPVAQAINTPVETESTDPLEEDGSDQAVIKKPMDGKDGKAHQEMVTSQSGAEVAEDRPFPVEPVETPMAVETDLAVTEQIPLVWELPQDLREKILQLKSSIHVYSEIPEQRFVIINMKRYQEGDSMRPDGFRLERIDRDGIVIDHGDGLVRLQRR
ncbi:MAG: general secretion pathway protein GspB [Candidatus Thiodiazotropha sp. (ex Monitilora ramsayi)]|nr:general secretion pathway protein GspB [Candidatus Thiodiazotropha sp. (ex Monitilora ramsayi)]